MKTVHVFCQSYNQIRGKTPDFCRKPKNRLRKNDLLCKQYSQNGGGGNMNSPSTAESDPDWIIWF